MLTADDLEVYEAEIRDRVWKHQGPREIFEGVLIEHARESAASYGFAAVSVPAALAYDTRGTIATALRLEKDIAMPNVAIEIPATDEGIEAFEQCIADAMNVSVTSIFSNARYRLVVDAYMSGLEYRVSAGLDVRSISSYAKFCVAAIEGADDPMLVPRACARLVTDLHGALFSGERWRALQERGARVQPLIVSALGGEDIEPIELARAHEALSDLYLRRFDLNAHLERLLRAAIKTRLALELRILEALEAKRRALPTTAPDVPDARNIADLGVNMYGLPHGYDLA
jgi:hypothetical protein